ncbi:DUF882 domain-containing protein [Myxococcota bacterium]|nr:DUF882 domain-containing protein [Myxococcota bacterium]MBU1535807.1 DUF882 domain-containing protein [Myxococcota bacterium]
MVPILALIITLSFPLASQALPRGDHHSRTLRGKGKTLQIKRRQKPGRRIARRHQRTRLAGRVHRRVGKKAITNPRAARSRLKARRHRKTARAAAHHRARRSTKRGTANIAPPRKVASVKSRRRGRAAARASVKRRNRHIAGTYSNKGKSIKLMARRSYTRASLGTVKLDKRKVKAHKRSPRVNPFPPMPVYRIHTRETAFIRLYDSRGNIRKSALKQFNHLVRCYRKSITIPIKYNLLVEMYQAWIHFGQPQVTVFSGCRRPPQASKTSRHVTGAAVDFSFDGISRRSLASYFLNRTPFLSSYQLGIGYYPRSYHIHLDVREKHAFWVQLVDEDGAGFYASNPYRAFARKRTARRASR